jgi:sugar phosphate isomerase/epimerase
MPLLSINTLIFQGHDIRTALREVAQLGIARVELAFIKGYTPELTDAFFTEEQGRQFRDLLDGFGLTGPAVSAHMDLGADDAVEAFRRRMLFAQALGARHIISNASSRQREARFYHNMERLADCARSMGITICLENPGDGDDHLVDSGRTGAVVVRQIGSAHVRLNYDIGNIFINTRGARRPEEDLADAIPCSAHFHLKDIFADPTGYGYCAIGGGVIDYRAVLRTLAVQAPAVPVGIEIPLRLKRGRDFVPWMDPEVPDLQEIRRTLTASLAFVTGQAE